MTYASYKTHDGDIIEITDETLKELNAEFIKIDRISPLTYEKNSKDNIFFENIINLTVSNQSEKSFTISVQSIKYNYSRDFDTKAFTDSIFKELESETIAESLSELSAVKDMKRIMTEEIIEDLYTKEGVMHVGQNINGIGIIEAGDSVSSVFNNIYFAKDAIVLKNGIRKITIPERLNNVIVKFYPSVQYGPEKYIIFDEISSFKQEGSDDNATYRITGNIAINRKKVNNYVLDTNKEWSIQGFELLQELNAKQKKEVFNLDIDF